MNEILPGLFHWTAFHEPIRARVSSYWLEPAGVVIDPKVPELDDDDRPGDLEEAWGDRPAPQQVVLTSGHHHRDAQAFVDAFGGIPIRCSREAATRLEGRLEAQPWRDGEELAPGVVGIDIGVLAPDEAALHLTGVPGGALALADALNHYGEALAFFPDNLLGEHPEQVKDGLKHRLRAQLEREFDTLLFAHGAPLVGGAKAALRAFVESPVGHEEFGQAL